MHLDSLGFTWIQMDSLGLTWIHLDSHGFTWIHLDSLGFTWIHLDSLGLTWTHLDSPGFTWTHLDSLGFTWTHLNSLDLTRTHLNSLGLTRTLPKLLRPKGKREKGGGSLFFPNSHLTTRPRVRACDRTETISRLVSLPPTSDVVDAKVNQPAKGNWPPLTISIQWDHPNPCFRLRNRDG